MTVPPEAAGLAAQLIHDIGGTHVPVAEELRPLWHAGLAHGANHLVTLVSSAADVLRAAGATDPAAVLGPLLSAALGNALAAGDSALTGPVARGDAGTVAPTSTLSTPPLPSERSTYLGLARATASRLADLPEPEMLDVLADVGARPHRQVVDRSERARYDPRHGNCHGTLHWARRAPARMVVARTRGELTAALAAPADGPRAVVMTMGALHDGHAQLIRAARERAEQVVVTIFVNPLQFGPNEDLDRYPRTLEADLDTCRSEGADIVFAPTPDVIYPGR